MKKTNQAIKMSDAILLLQNGFIDVPEGAPRKRNEIAVGTMVANMAYFGFAPSKAALDAMSTLSDADLEDLWAKLKPALKYVTADDRKMGKFVVYKNFPKEVLSMSEAEYWLKQVLMYWGFANELFTEEEKDREPVFEKISPKVLDLANDETRLKIFDKLTKQSSDWTDFQKEQASFLMKSYPTSVIDLDAFTQKTNGIKLIASEWSGVLNGERSIKVSTATDVMRLAAALSDVDVSLRKVGKFRKFSRPERRVLISMLDGAKHLEGDLARAAQGAMEASALFPASRRFQVRQGQGRL